MKAATKKLVEAMTKPLGKTKLARRTFTLEFKADVVRHRKAENLSWADAGKAFDMLPKLVKDWEALYDKAWSLAKPDAAQYPRSRLKLARCAPSCRG